MVSTQLDTNESPLASKVDLRSVRLRLLAVSVLVVVVISVVLSYLALDNLKIREEQEVRRDIQQTEAWFNNIIVYEVAGLEIAIDGIKQREDILQEFVGRDRQALLTTAEPFYKNLNQKFNVTHFYFFDPQRTTFLRIHSPERHSDQINRATLMETEKTAVTVAGLELGVLGTLTLRVVAPWFHNEELIGYLELGMEIGHVLKQLESTLGISAYIAIDKAMIDEEQINSSGISEYTFYQLTGNHLLVKYGTSNINDEFIARTLEIDDYQIIRLKSGEQSRFSVIHIPLSGFEQNLGKLIVFKDISQIELATTKQRSNYLFLILSMGGLGILVFYLIVNRVQGDINQTQSRLLQKLHLRSQALSETESNLKQAQSLASIGFWQLDHSDDTMSCSEEVNNILNLEQKKRLLNYEELLTYIHPDDRDGFKQKLKSAFSGGQPVQFVHRVSLQDNAVKWVEQRFTTTSSADNKRHVTKGTMQDVTPLKSTEQRIEAIFSSTTDGIILINHRGIICDVNPAVISMFGYQRHELLNENVSMLMTRSVADEHDGYIKNYLQTGEAKVIGKGREVTGQSKTGTLLPLRLGVGKVELEGEMFFVGSLTDLSDMKNLETQLRHSQKMEAIGELSGGIAHDFNNILGIIIGQLDLLKTQLRDEKHLKRLEKAQEASFRGAALTKKLLNFSRHNVEASSPINVNEIIENLNELIGTSLTARVNVELKLQENLWLTEVDPHGFEDALINLALNARDAMENSGNLRIQTRNVTLKDTFCGNFSKPITGEYIEVVVSDTGQGIPKEVLDKVFDPFFTTKKEGKGTGLGLAMVYGFVERSQGAINIYSQLGLGTSFKIYLPRAKEQVDQFRANNDKYPASQNTQGGTETILIVDDEESLAIAAREILEHLGYQTLVVHNARDAIELLDKNPGINLVFSDVAMAGGMDGFALAQFVSQSHPEVCVLLTSGYTGKINLKPEYEPWMKTMLSKPYRDIELAQKIRQTLDGAKSNGTP